MGRIEQFLHLFYDGNGFDVMAIVTLCVRIGMILSVGVFAFSIFAYIHEYKLVEALFSKLSGNAREYDRIRRKQMKAELEASKDVFAKPKKKSFMTGIYALIKQTGIMEKIPGFSESTFLTLSVLASLIIFVWMSFLRGIIVGFVSTGAFLVVLWYCLSLIAYNRRIKLEEQLLQFVNACATSSMQYASLIDIFGNIYDQFRSPLREALEYCYTEAKQTNNKEMAIEHLKDRFDSVQFAFVIDNLELCSKNTGDYYSASRDIAETISIYMTSHEKKKTSLRNAKVLITAMFAFGIAIVFALSLFLDNLAETLLGTSIGNIAIIALILLYFYGLNMKAEK